MKKIRYMFKLWGSKNKTEKLIVKIVTESKFDINPDK